MKWKAFKIVMRGAKRELNQEQDFQKSTNGFDGQVHKLLAIWCIYIQLAERTVKTIHNKHIW